MLLYGAKITVLASKSHSKVINHSVPSQQLAKLANPTWLPLSLNKLARTKKR